MCTDTSGATITVNSRSYVVYAQWFYMLMMMMRTEMEVKRMTMMMTLVMMEWVGGWGRVVAFFLHRVGPAAFQCRVSLTIELRVAVHHGGDADQHLPPVSLHHQLQLAAGLLDQLPGVTERQVLRHSAVNLTGGVR